jgi:hypothetical protein
LWPCVEFREVLMRSALRPLQAPLLRLARSLDHLLDAGAPFRRVAPIGAYHCG